MPGPRTSTAILELRGAFRNHPGRHQERMGEPATDEPVGMPPEILDDACKAAWNELVEIAPAGVLCRFDRVALEIAAVLLAQFRESPNDFPVTKLGRLNALLGQFGMTPSDRSKVSIARPAVSSKYDKLSG